MRKPLTYLLAAVAGGVAVGAGTGDPRSAGTGAVLGATLALAPTRPLVACAGAVVALLAVAPLRATGFAAEVLVIAHAVAIGRWGGFRAGLAGASALLLASTLAALLADESIVPFVYVPAIGWALGRGLREREALSAGLRERVRELEEEREAHAALSVRYERARIAGELHDVVAHAVSVVVVQAAAGQRLAAADATGADRALAHIAEQSRRAQADIARLVELLETPTAAPGVALVEELVDRAASSGLDVRLRLHGDFCDVPDRAAHVAFRIVQEGLTNALRHASGAAVAVTLHRGGGRLEVDAANGPDGTPGPLAEAGTHTGLIGLREAVGALGGSLTAGPTADGGWLLRATLPLAELAPSPARMTHLAGDHPAG